MYQMGDFSIRLAGMETIYPGKWKYSLISAECGTSFRYDTSANKV